MPVDEYAEGLHRTVPDDVVRLERAITRISRLAIQARQHGRNAAEAGVNIERAGASLLRLLDDEGEPMRPGEIAGRLGVEPPHVTRQAQRLERDGFVERVPDPDDGRCQRVRLSPVGREAVHAIRAVGLRRIDEALAGWSPKDRHDLALLVHRMVDDFLVHAECNQTFGPPDRP